MRRALTGARERGSSFKTFLLIIQEHHLTQNRQLGMIFPLFSAPDDKRQTKSLRENRSRRRKHCKKKRTAHFSSATISALTRNHGAHFFLLALFLHTEKTVYLRIWVAVWKFSRILSSQDVVGIGTQKKTRLKPKPIEPKNLSSLAFFVYLHLATLSFQCRRWHCNRKNGVQVSEWHQKNTKSTPEGGNFPPNRDCAAEKTHLGEANFFTAVRKNSVWFRRRLGSPMVVPTLAKGRGEWKN